MRQAVERAKEINAKHARLARELAAQGRGDDTEVAHVARGELVVPRALQNPEVLAALQRAAAVHNISLETLSIGNFMNIINPETGAPEFGHSVDDQPRVPKGQGDRSGEWTRVGKPAKIRRSYQAMAAADGQTVAIVHSDGTTEARRGGSAAWRNNNPGNIEAGPFARSMGAVGENGRWAIFPDEGTGRAAMEALLDRPDYSSLTIDKAIEKRTPPKEKGNNTEQTKQLVRQFSGLPGDAIVGRLTSEEKQRLYAAITRSEGWREGAATHHSPTS